MAGFVAEGYWCSADSKYVIVEETPRLGHVSVVRDGRMTYDECPRVTWQQFADHVRRPGLFAAASGPAEIAEPVQWVEAVGGLQAAAFPEFAPKDPKTGRIKPEQLALI